MASSSNEQRIPDYSKLRQHNNIADDTINVNNNNIHTYENSQILSKRTWKLHGVTLVFGSSKTNTHEYFDTITSYVETQLDQQASSNGQLRKLVNAMETTNSDNMEIDSNDETSPVLSDKKVRQKIQFDNMRFLDFMFQVVKLTQEHNQTKKDTSQLKPTYNFKAANPSTTENAFDRLWNERFKELVQFKTEFGHSNVSRTTKGYEQLGNWLADQRRKLRRGKMTEAQFKSLSELGVEWERS